MKILAIIKSAYLLIWLFSALKSAVVASIIALLFGLFSETWFFLPAFWGFWLPCLFYSAVAAHRERQALQPFEDVAATFSGTASQQQKVRALKALTEDELEDEFEDDDDDDEVVTLVDVSANKEKIKQVLTALINEQLIVLSPQVKTQVKQYFEDNDLDSEAICSKDFLCELLEDRAFIWQSDDIDSAEEYYQQTILQVAQYSKKLAISDVHCEFNPEEDNVTLQFCTSIGRQHWQFKHYSRAVSENFIIHLALLLKSESELTLGVLPFDEDAEDAWAFLLPQASFKNLYQQGLFNGKEMVS